MKRKIVSLLILITIILSTAVSFANSSAPPRLTIIVYGQQEGLSIKLKDAEMTELSVQSRLLYKEYNFYDLGMNSSETPVLLISYKGNSEEIAITQQLDSYDNIFTLNLKSMKLSEGASKVVTAFIVFSRVAMTIAIEALVFLAFGYRKSLSWMIFILMNLITQAGLNIWLMTMRQDGYIIIALVIGEFFVLITEMVLTVLLIREHGRLRALGFAFAANIASLFLGGYLLTVL